MKEILSNSNKQTSTQNEETVIGGGEISDKWWQYASSDLASYVMPISMSSFEVTSTADGVVTSCKGGKHNAKYRTLRNGCGGISRSGSVNSDMSVGTTLSEVSGVWNVRYEYLGVGRKTAAYCAAGFAIF